VARYLVTGEPQGAVEYSWVTRKQREFERMG